MKHIGTVLFWFVAAAVVGLSAINWSTLMAAAPLDLIVAQVEAPLGVLMLALSGVFVVLLFIVYLQNQVRSLIETRRLLKDVQRVQDLADRAEASRIEGLDRRLTTEFKRLDERLNSLTSLLQGPGHRSVDGAVVPSVATSGGLRL